MIKEFVPYEESLALKKLGFDELCFGLFVRDKSLLVKEMPNQNECEIYFGGILVPTFSQAFRFFRKKYKLWGNIGMQSDNYYTLMIYETLPDCRVIYNNKGYETYEEAELACLKKLIEIVKQQSS